MSMNEKQPGDAATCDRESRAAFTLTEILVSMAILGLIMVVLFGIFEQVNKAWLTSESRVETFTQARAILDLMSRELSQAVATQKITFRGEANKVYFIAPVNTNPANQADLCEVGYEFESTDLPGKPTLKITRRLTQPTPLNIGAGGYWDFYANPAAWWAVTSFDPSTEAVLATNCILNLQFQYLKKDGTLFPTPYQSQFHLNSLPYAIAIYVDAVDSRTAARLRLVPNVGTAWQPITNSTLRSFSTIVYLPNTAP
jgi:prepilin-type N-terminal cleavage/methylation domain-containing protein